MHYTHFVPGLLAIALAAPAPAPQNIDFKKVDALLPEMTRTIPVTAKPTIITFDPTAAIESVQDATPTLLHLKNKRNNEGPWDNSGCNVCPAQPTIADFYNVAVASDSAFLADTAIAGKASEAVTPSGYSKVYTNLKASANGYVYMGYTVPPSYDPAFCSEKCDSIAGCASFNLFFERNPAVDACSDQCQDPPAFANIKCTFWGGAITPGAAKNDGQWRNRFHVVVAGSNGYVKNGIPEVPGYSAVQSLTAVSINAPRDCNGVDTYMGYKLFTNTPFDIRLCAAACDAETAYSREHGNPRICNFWNTYLLDRNGESQGQYCSLYTEAWDNSFATNDGQWRDNDHYTISSSYSSYNLTSPGFPVCPADIAYLNTEGAEFCTAFNSYVAPHTLSSVVGTTSVTSIIETTITIPTITATQTILATVTAVNNKRAATSADEIAIETYKVIFPAKNTASHNATAPVTIHVTDGVAKRTVLATPTSIANWQSTRIAEACSYVATGTITDYTTTSISTSYIATATDVSTEYLGTITTTTSTVTVPGVQLSSPTAIVGSLSGAPQDIDDEAYSLILPFAIGAFGAYSTNIFFSSNGVISINSGSAAYANEYGFPTSQLPDVAILGLWDDLYIYQGTQQGIYYQIDGAVGSRSVTFEMYMSAFQRRSEYYHFSMTFYENQPGVSLFKYYEVSLNGVSATVGAQRLTGNKNLRFSHLQPLIHNNMFVLLDTNAGTMSSGNL